MRHAFARQTPEARRGKKKDKREELLTSKAAEISEGLISSTI
jgi:hypothetical protein